VAIDVYLQFEHAVFEKNLLFPFPLVAAKWIADYFENKRYAQNFGASIYSRVINIDLPPAQMAKQIKFGAQIINHIWCRGFFSCSGRFSLYAPNIRCANKLAHYKQEDLVWSASPYCNVIAYSFCWRERKRKYVSQWQAARSKWKWTSIATVSDLCPTTVKILTHVISRYHLPLKYWKKAAKRKVYDM
jgi:hypothetical protein